MKKITLGLIASLMLCSTITFAQTNSSESSLPQPPAAWITFQQQENAKREAFFKQMATDREAFLQANPEVKTYLQEMRAAAQARMAAWRAAHPRPGNLITNPTP